LPQTFNHGFPMNTWIYTHAACLEHRPGPHHPESPDRLLAVLKALDAPEFAAAGRQEAPMGTREQIVRIHDPDYVDAVEAAVPRQGYRALDAGDTIMSPGSWEAVLRCVGAACAAVDAVVAGRARNAFCATRPCGHHAEAGRAMGFCVFNQAAIAALHAREVHGIRRVAVVDFDVHHGNGTQNSFYDDPDLFYGSSHQSPFYPGTGSRSESGVAQATSINIPLAARRVIPGRFASTCADRAAARTSTDSRPSLADHFGRLRCASPGPSRWPAPSLTTISTGSRAN
jgi:acetoin utilization deacetylase AcuC-like enzyme